MLLFCILLYIHYILPTFYNTNRRFAIVIIDIKSLREKNFLKFLLNIPLTFCVLDDRIIIQQDVLFSSFEFNGFIIWSFSSCERKEVEIGVPVKFSPARASPSPPTTKGNHQFVIRKSLLFVSSSTFNLLHSSRVLCILWKLKFIRTRRDILSRLFWIK